MFGIDKKLAAYTDKLGRESPKGHKYVTVPWKDMTYLDQKRLPFHFRSEFPTSEILITVSWILIVIGAFTSFGVSLAFGTALLITMHLSSRQAWLDSGAWDVISVDAPKEILEKSDVIITIVIKNNEAKRPLHNLIISARFSGSVREFQCQAVDQIPARGSANVRFSFTADRGMGLWELSEITVTVRDTLGLKALSVEHPHKCEVNVHAEHSPLSHFEIERAGVSLHSGDFQVNAPGTSTSFLSMREWRHGDSLSHIDWKRSLRSGNLLVKEFERMCATNATIFLDTSEFGHGEFSGVSTLETLKDTAMAVIRCLVGQQVQVQVITPSIHIPLGKSQSHVDFITTYIRNLTAHGKMDFAQLVLNNLHHVESDSVVVMILTSSNSQLPSLLKSFVLLDDRRVETNLAVINTAAFIHKIKSEANLEMEQIQFLDFIVGQMTIRNQNEDIKRVLEKVTRHLYMINPETTFADIYSLKHGH